MENLTEDVSPEEVLHPKNLVDALLFFMASNKTAINGIVIAFSGEDLPLEGRLVFEKKGMKSFPEAYLDSRHERRKMNPAPGSE